MTTQTFDTPQLIHLEVRVTSADVEIVASDRATTDVTIEPSNPNSSQDHDAAARVRVVHEGNHVRVLEEKSFKLRRGSYDVRIAVPTDSKCRVSIGSGDLTVQGRVEEIDVQSGSGDASIEHASHGRISSGSGDFDIRTINGKLDAKTGSGDIRIRNAHDGIVAKTGSGDVSIEAAHNGSFDLLAGSGDIAIRVPEGVAALLDIMSGNGEIVNQLTSSASKPDTETAIEVRARSGSGDILIARAAV